MEPWPFVNRTRSYFSEMFDRFRQLISERDGLFGSDLPSNGTDKGNTTSVTKIVDGHRYVINETVYSGGDGNNKHFYKVRVVNVVPLNETTSKELDIDSSENDVNRLPSVQKVGVPEKLTQHKPL